MTYYYVGDGTVYTGSFALVHKNLYVKYKFDKYSIAYDKSAAEKGILKKVFIQKVILKNIVKSWHKNVVMYVDNLKSMYNEYDLLTLQEAQDIIDQSTYVPPNCSLPPNPPAPIPATYAPNTILYSLKDAEKGQIVKIVILRSLPQSPTIYEDTLHSLWNESELISKNEAKNLALDYWESRKASLENLYDKLI